MTPQHLKQIGDLIDTKLKKTESHLSRFDDDIKILKSTNNSVVEKIDGLVDNLTEWKSELFDNIDGLAGGIKDSREFREITTEQVVNNRKRIDDLEKKVFETIVTEAKKPAQQAGF